MLHDIMKKNIVYFCVTFFAVALLLSGCKSNKEEEADNIKKAYVDSVAVSVFKAEQKTLMVKKTYTGSLEGEQQASVVSQLAERIIEIPVKVGDLVKAGQVLIKLDKGGATSQYYQAQSNLKNIEKNLNRMKSLFEGGAVSQQALDEVETGYEIAKANFDAMRRALEITSPLSGVVTEVKLNPGEFAAPGLPIITVAKISQLKLKLSIGEAEIPFIKNGHTVKIYSELNPDISTNGRVQEISGGADMQTRTFEAKALFSNPKGNWFKPGMFAKAEIELASTGKNTVIPKEAVMYTAQESNVFVVENNKAVLRKIKIGMQSDNEVEVLEGLKSGELVVIAGMNNLKDGSNVITVQSK